MSFELAEIRVEVPGPFAMHNMPCAVCRERHAVLTLDNGLMQPCWDCQEAGWRLRKTRARWRYRIARWIEEVRT